MKLIFPLLLASFTLTQSSALSQSHRTAHAAAHGAASSSKSHGCVNVGKISSSIPGLPVGACPKALYTLSQTASFKLDYASPMIDMDNLRNWFPIDSSSVTLAYDDIKVGPGALVLPGKFLSVLYSGYLAEDGTEFDSTTKRNNEPIVVQYGKHGVIPGWDTGLDGMRVGGKRRLYIPYQLAYGTKGSPPVIPAKAELVFDVELLSQSDTMPTPKPVPPAAPPSAKPATAPPASAAPATSGAPAAAPKPQ